MSRLQDLHAFIREEALSEPRWPRHNVLKVINTEFDIENILTGIAASGARGIQIPAAKEFEPSWAEDWIHYLQQAKILEPSECGPVANRVAGELVKKVGKQAMILQYKSDGEQNSFRVPKPRTLRTCDF